MTLATHTAIGAGIGFSVGNPALGFVLGFASHLLVDMIPHGDSELAKKLRVHKKKKLPMTLITIDAIAALFITMLFFNIDGSPSNLALTAAIAGSVLPDLLIGIYDVTKTKYLRWFNRLHFFFHDFILIRHKDVKLGYSLIGQAGLIALLFNLV
ncbi:hypothetical protein IH979_00170 [Patescibacteria group bacterium]|nr:hypothetical protein [Patescibacteria group bacterium]